MSEARVMITGGDGYVGRRLAQTYLARTREPILLWLRAADEGEFAEKTARLDRLFGDHGGRVRYRWGDLRDERPFRGVDPRGIRTIVHAAAVTRFNVDADTARTVNVEGTEKLLRFAAGCPSLARLGLLSTVYAAGLTTGPVEEAPFDGEAGFANHYERSKWAAESILLGRYGDLPWQVIRLATVIADGDDGRVDQHNAVHNTLKLFYHGLLSLMPGRPDTPLYFVTGDFVADATWTVLDRGETGGIYHVSHGLEEAVPLGELVDLAFDTFGRRDDFRSRRVLRPLWADAESFDLLATGLDGFRGGVLAQAVASVAPFARQLFVGKDVRNRRLGAVLGRRPATDLRRLVRNVCDHLADTKWRRA